ncbi:MAG TPA: hypothetical protein VEX68_14310 [Bryobacteraceae bacterium]|nr:hypothetical protein [Bryobacteraceae bacterium]
MPCQRLLTAVFAVVFVLLIALVAPSIAIDEGIRSFGRPLLQASCSKQIGCIHVLSVAIMLLIETVTTTPRIVTSEPVRLQEFSRFAIIRPNRLGSRAPPAFSLFS